MMTIQSIVTEAFESGVLTVEQELCIDDLLRHCHCNPQDLNALDQLVHALISDRIEHQCERPDTDR